MVYYILLPNDSDDETDYSTIPLGEVSFKNFWCDTGYDVLERLIEKYSDILPTITIKDQTSKEYSIVEFLDIISKLKVIRAYG